MSDPEVERVSELKVLVERITDVDPSEQKLIYRGRILRDDRSCASYGLKDGITIHLVGTRRQRATRSAADGGADPARERQSNPFGLSPAMMRAAMNNPIMQQMLRNPEFLKTMMEMNPQLKQVIDRNPEVGQLLSDPDMMKKMLEMTTNPEMLDEMMRSQDRAFDNISNLPGGFDALARINRDLIQPMHEASSEIARSTSEARERGSLGSGGIRGIMDPSLGPGQDEGDEGVDDDVQAALFGEDVVADEMPNPWSPEGSRTQPAQAGRGGGPGPGPGPGGFGSLFGMMPGAPAAGARAGPPANPFAELLRTGHEAPEGGGVFGSEGETGSSGSGSGGSSSSSTSGSQQGAAPPGAGAVPGMGMFGMPMGTPGGMPGMPGMPGMGAMPGMTPQALGQMLGNPEMMARAQQMYSNPQVRGMAEQMMRNPQARGMMERMMADPSVLRPLLQNHPAFQNPMMQSMLQNDDFLRSIGQMSSQMRRQMGAQPATGDSTTAPAPVPGTGDPSTTTPPPNPFAQMFNPQMIQQLTSAFGGSTAPAPAASPTAATPTDATPTGDSEAAPAPASPAAAAVPNPLMAMAQQMVAAQQQQRSTLKEKYESQLKTLLDMGFPNEELNIRALEQGNGNVNIAVELIVTGRVAPAPSGFAPFNPFGGGM